MQNKNESTGNNVMDEIYSGTVHNILKIVYCSLQKRFLYQIYSKAFCHKKCYSLFQFEWNIHRSLTFYWNN